MANGEAMIQPRKPVTDDLEPYRRLIEIQKELVQMSQQHEQARREFVAFRERVARELTELPRAGNGVQQRLRRSVSKLFRQLTRIAAPETSRRTFKPKQTAYVKSH